MKRPATGPRGKLRWTFVARRSPTHGRLAMKKVAVNVLEGTRTARSRAGVKARLDSPALASELTQAFRAAVRRVKRANGRNAVGA